MTTIVDPSLAAYLAELAETADKILEKHYTKSQNEDNMLRHMAPFTVQVCTEDGVIAQFLEEGIELYPEDK